MILCHPHIAGRSGGKLHRFLPAASPKDNWLRAVILGPRPIDLHWHPAAGRLRRLRHPLATRRGLLPPGGATRWAPERHDSDDDACGMVE